MSFWKAAIILWIVSFAVGAGYRYSRVPGFDASIQRVGALLGTGRYAKAEKTLRWTVARYPERSGTPQRVALAQIASKLGHWQTAAAALRDVPDSDPQASLVRIAEGDAWRRLDRAVEAENCWRRALSSDPDALLAHHGLLYLYGLQLRRDDLLDELWWLYDHDQAGARELTHILIAGQRVWEADEASEKVRAFAEADPRDVHSRRALGIYAMQLGHVDQADRMLAGLRERFPDDLETWLALLDVRLSVGDLDAAKPLLDHVPADAERDYRYWKLAGTYALERGDRQAAVANYRRAVEKFPFDRELNNKLSWALRLTGDERGAAFHARLAGTLALLHRRCHSLHAMNWSAELARELIGPCEELGLIEEARGWTEVALEQSPDDPALLAIRERLAQAPATSVRRPPSLESLK